MSNATDRILRIARAAALRVDSWVNTLTNVGTATGKSNLSFSLATSEMLSLVDCENLYNFDGIAARVCDAVPVNAMRGGFSVSTGDIEVETSIAAGVDELNATELVTRAWTWGRVYGGGALYLGIDDGRTPDQPVDEGAIRALRWMVDVDRRDLYPMTWEADPDSPRFGQPETYRLSRMGGTATETITVHHSRIVRFEGVTPTRRRRLLLQGWGESVLQRAFMEMQAMRGAFAAAGALLQESSQGVLKIKDLMELMGSDKDDTLRRRLMLMDESRSIARSLLLDADGESYERVETGALTGVADVMDRMVLLLSGVTGIPVTILLGKSPSGMNATGESDIRAWYDQVASEREKYARSRIERIVRVLLLSREGPTQGKEPEGWSITFPSLWQPSPGEEEDLRGKVATRDVAYITAQVLTPEEVAVSRFRRHGWSPDTVVDLDARTRAMETDREPSLAGDDGGASHEDVAAVLARVAAREIPRASGLAMLEGLGLTPERAEATMGETGATFFTAPERTHAAEMEAMRAELARAKASLRGHQSYTARIIQRAKEGGLELGAFTAQEPTEVGEGDALEPGDVVAVPVEDSRFDVRRTDGRSDGVAVVLQLPPAYAARLPTEVPAEDLHVTLVYLGLNDRWDSQAIDRCVAAVRQWALTVAPIEATLGGIGRFAGGPAGEPVYVPVDSPAITDTRPALLAFLRAAGFEAAKNHGFTPHLTLAYVQPGDATPPPVTPFAVTCPMVSVWWDTVRVDIELTGGAS